jgi:RHS repeat-associated protein
VGRLIGTTTTYSFLSNTPFTTSYSYDANSNRTGFTAPDGSTNSYSYDTLNRMSNLTSSWAGSFGVSYDALGRRTQLTRPNGIATYDSYDSLSRPLSVLHKTGGSTIDGASYTLDSAGNRTAKTDYLASVTSNYSYDGIYELTQTLQGGTTKESYTYDPVGNRLSSLGVSSYTNNISNELTSTTNTSYTYDYNGNLTSKTISSGTTDYAWDFENRLTSVTLPNSGGAVTFKYDPFGRRIYKQSPTATNIFVYDGDGLAETVNSAGGTVARYTQGQDIDEPLAVQRGSATDYYEADLLGSITSLTATNGSIVQTYTYDSFGNTTSSSGSLTNFFRYTAREFDVETNFYYYRARYYDPTSGRFTSEDPFGLNGGINRYSYTGNSPVDLIDPSGLCPCAPSGKAFYPEVYQDQGQSAGWLGNGISLFEFRRGGFLDAQKYGGSPAYANYVFGVYTCAAGFSLSQALNFANTYGYLRSQYPPKAAMDPNHKSIPAANVANITLGFNDCKNGTLCTQ